MKKEEEEKREEMHLVHFILTLDHFRIIPNLLTKKWRVDQVQMDIKWQSHILNEVYAFNHYTTYFSSQNYMII